MFNFYKKVAVIFLTLVVATLLMTYVCLKYAYVRDELLPIQVSAIPWKLVTATDAKNGGASTILVNDAAYSLDFNFEVKNSVDYPYVSYTLAFDSLESPKQLIDLSAYSTLFFKVKCDPQNILSFVAYTHDPQITKPADISTYRIPTAYFSCSPHWTDMEIDLKHLQVPDWWLNLFDIELSDGGNYRLDKTVAFSFGISRQTPADTPSNVKIVELTLCGWSRRYIFILGVLVAAIWGGFAVWIYKQHTNHLVADIQRKMRKDQPLIAHKQLTIESPKDKEKQLILRFIASEYTDPDLGLEAAVSKLGISRTKINEILKAEVGFTFSAYLNKLRLSEAARLLSENEEVNVAEIAYSVGYNNVSYFNRLFKIEYGCTPKAFKNIKFENQKDQPIL